MTFHPCVRGVSTKNPIFYMRKLNYEQKLPYYDIFHREVGEFLDHFSFYGYETLTLYLGRSREWFKSMLKLLKDERKYWPLGYCYYALWQIYVVNQSSFTYTRFSWQRLSTEKINFHRRKKWDLKFAYFSLWILIKYMV